MENEKIQKVVISKEETTADKIGKLGCCIMQLVIEIPLLIIFLVIVAAFLHSCN